MEEFPEVKALFKSRFGKDPAEFRSLAEVNTFVEKRIGRRLGVEPRGSIIPVVEADADKAIDKALGE